MGEYADMAELLAKPWVGNVYAPAADTWVHVLILTSEGKVRKVQVETSRIYASGGSWWSVAKKHIKSDSDETDMFYVFAEDRPPKKFLGLSGRTGDGIVRRQIRGHLSRSTYSVHRVRF
jgi:hypothetical protein